MTIAETVYQKLKAAPPEIAREVLHYLEFLESRANPSSDAKPATFDPFFGTLKSSGLFDGDPVELQRRLREEWNRGWDR